MQLYASWLDIFTAHAADIPAVYELQKQPVQGD